MDEFFTDAERIMFIKRFGALLLFERGYSAYKVHHIIGMSQTTATKIFNDYVEGRYNGALRTIAKTPTPALLTFIDKLARSYGSERWKLLDNALKK